MQDTESTRTDSPHDLAEPIDRSEHSGQDPAVTGQGQSKSLQPKCAENALTDSVLNAVRSDADLAAVVEAWASLPDAMKAGILAMVKAAK